MYIEEIKDAAISTIKTQALVNRTFGTESREAKFLNNLVEEPIQQLVEGRQNFELNDRIREVLEYECERFQFGLNRAVTLRIDVELQISPTSINGTKTEVSVTNS